MSVNLLHFGTAVVVIALSLYLLFLVWDKERFERNGRVTLMWLSLFWLLIGIGRILTAFGFFTPVQSLALTGVLGVVPLVYITLDTIFRK